MELRSAVRDDFRSRTHARSRFGRRRRALDSGQSPKGSSRALARRRLNWLLEEGPLENRQLLAALIDLTFQNTLTVNGAIFSTAITTVGAGTGLIDPFVRISSN